MKKSTRLIGWLVSYAEDKLGTSHEIRTGRTLISSAQGQNGSAITLKEKSIDAPHIALKAGKNHTVQLQDIFTKSGTYISKANSSKEKQIDGVVTLEHGDWIRIGNTVRFQVCLIDAPGK